MTERAGTTAGPPSSIIRDQSPLHPAPAARSVNTIASLRRGLTSPTGKRPLNETSKWAIHPSC